MCAYVGTAQEQPRTSVQIQVLVHLGAWNSRNPLPELIRNDLQPDVTFLIEIELDKLLQYAGTFALTIVREAFFTTTAHWAMLPKALLDFTVA